MCVIAVCQKRKLSKAEFDAIWDRNSHGAGLAWREGKKVVYEKGFMTKEALSSIYYSERVTLPNVVHFRIATHGGVIPELTHPFLCDEIGSLPLEYKGKKEVLFHNGIYYDFEAALDLIQKLFGKELMAKIEELPMSDSRAMALVQALIPSQLTKLVLQPNRVVVFGPKRTKVYGGFEEIRGIKFSNTFWRPVMMVKISKPSFPATTPSSVYAWPSYYNSPSKKEDTSDLDKFKSMASREDHDYDIMFQRPAIVMPQRDSKRPSGKVFGNVRYGR